MGKKSLRDEMPETAGFIDSLREAFGKEMVDEQIRQGMRGQPVFWARENGREIGTRSDSAASEAVKWDQRGVSYLVPKNGENE